MGSELTATEMMFGSRKQYKYLKCADCGAMQMMTHGIDGKSLYLENYYSFLDGPTHAGLKEWTKRAIFRAIVAHELGGFTLLGWMLARWRPNMAARALRNIIKTDSSILDVGCGAGHLLDALAVLGFRSLTGIEPYIKSDILGNGFKVFKNLLSDLNRSQKFDVIMLHHSFEHMSNPHEVFEQISELLDVGGVCVLRVPVCDSMAYETYGEHWVQLDAPRHLFLYTTDAMSKLASRHSMRIREVIDDSTIFGLVASEQYLAGIPLNGDRSYFRSPFKKLIRPSAVTREQLKKFAELTEVLNKKGRGDQRIFYLVNDEKIK